MNGILMQDYLNTSSVEKIGFFSPLAGVGVDCGYGYSAVQLISSWQRQGVPVWGFDRTAPVIFNFGQPHFYERVEGKLNIGYTPWESNEVPEGWLPYMETMDEIWTTCEANATWYREAGISIPVKVLHHGLNREHYPLRRRWVNAGSAYRFLHIGEPTPRKGGEMTYRAFREVFGDREDVRLTIKGRPKFKIDAPNVDVIDRILSQDEMRGLYLSHHAMVYPTNGEGFGLIPFQGAATGMPTAVTNWSGPVDYMDYCFPINVKELVVPGYEPHTGMWASPSEDHLSMWMEDFVDHREHYFDKAYLNGFRMDKDWSWDSIARRSLKMLSDSLE